MMLQALMAYADREGLGDPDFQKVGVRWLIPLNSDGRLMGGPIPLAENPDSKKPKPRTLWRPFTSANELNQGNKSQFLCDTLERSVLFLDENSISARQVQHHHFQQLLREAADECPADASKLHAVLQFLGDTGALQRLYGLLRADKAKPSDVATFSVDGSDLLELEELKAFWRRRRESKFAVGQRRICLATGILTEVLDTHEKITGVPGSMSMGANLICFDKDSFRSYSLDQAQNASLSIAAELKIRSSLQALVERSREQKLVFHNTIYLHWTRRPVEMDPFDLLANPDEAAVAVLLKSPRSGQPSLGVEPNDYFAVSLSGNGARIVVRDWLETTVQQVKQRVADWFEDLEIVDFYHPSAQPSGAFKIWALLANLVPDKDAKPDFEKLPPQFPAFVLRSAFTGGSVPDSVLAAALRREILDRSSVPDKNGQRKQFRPARFALMKLCLLRSPTRKEGHTMTNKLDPESKDVAYLCGQLFAVVGRLQLIALGSVGASIAERTYGGVATRPATTLGPLFTKVPAYLKKANVRYPGAGTNKQKELESLCMRIEKGGGLPQTLALQEQARFALGYYCQLAEYRARREEAELEKLAGQDDATL